MQYIIINWSHKDLYLVSKWKFVHLDQNPLIFPTPQPLVTIILVCFHDFDIFGFHIREIMQYILDYVDGFALP